MIFDVDFVRFEISRQQYYEFNSTNGKIKKSIITNENLFVTLTENNKLVVMQIFPSIVK